MSCIRIPTFHIRKESMNVNLLNQIMHLPDGIRKELRLLAKQYELLEMYKEPNDLIEITSNITVRENPYIVRYRNFEGSEIFEWEIEEEKLK